MQEPSGFVVRNPANDLVEIAIVCFMSQCLLKYFIVVTYFIKISDRPADRPTFPLLSPKPLVASWT